MSLARYLSTFIRNSQGSTDIKPKAKLLQAWRNQHRDRRQIGHLVVCLKFLPDKVRPRSRVIDQIRGYSAKVLQKWQTQQLKVCTIRTLISIPPVHSCCYSKRIFHCCGQQQHYRVMGRKGKKKGEEGDANEQPSDATNTKKKQRKKNSKKLHESPVPTKINLVAIGTGGPGTSQSLLVTTEFSRFMFNCGEGTQRLTIMSKELRVAAYANIRGLDHIFITHKSWENTGGLLGIAMTLESQKNPDARGFLTREQTPKMTCGNDNPEITLHGPYGVEKIAMMAKKFAVKAKMNIAKADGVFENNALTIIPVVFTKDDSKIGLDEYDPEPKRQKREFSPFYDNGTDEAFAYICKAKPPQPKINVEKCLDAGITMGPMVGKLQRGESVALDDGTIVHPDQVTDKPESDERPFLILECPGMEFLPSLKSCKPLLDHMTGNFDQSFAVVVHMTPANVFNSTDYQSWMRGFHKSTDHLVMNRDACAADLVRVRDHQARLNIVSSDVFPLLPESENNIMMKPNRSEEDDSKKEEKEGQIVKACSGLHYVYRGNQQGFHIEADEFNCKSLQETYLSEPGVVEALSVLRDSSDSQGSSSEYPKVVFLGTGSSEPNRMRAQSCVVVHLSEESVIILDCGENSYGQLYRFYGHTEANQVLKKVKAIFISHMHADHHLGLFSLMKERKNAFDEDQTPFIPVLLMAPVQIRRWLKFYNTELEPVTHLFRFVKHQLSIQEFSDGVDIQKESFEKVQEELNLSKYEPVEVVHCHDAFGVALTHSSGFKLAYSGDTRPCDNLISAGESCDLLIHEATHEDALLGHAKASNHSTFSEAINVGERMKAKYTILTHFSQRYPHMVPLFDMTLPENVGIAFDNMVVNPSNLKYLSKMIPTLTALFVEEIQKLEIKKMKRTRQQAGAGAAEAVGSNS